MSQPGSAGSERWETRAASGAQARRYRSKARDKALPSESGSGGRACFAARAKMG